MKRCAALMIMALCLVGGANTASAQYTGQDAFLSAIHKMKRSVAPLMCFRALPPRSRPALQPSQAGGAPPNGAAQAPPQEFQPIAAATAFFITRHGDFLTAAHAVTEFQPGRSLASCAMSIWFESPIDAAGNYSAQAFFVSVPQCVSDLGLDIARCRTIDDLGKIYDGRFMPDPVEFDSGQRDDGTAVAITGFPLLTTTPISSRGYIGGYIPAAQNAPRMAIDRAAWPGGSGSPVYDWRGRVLGVLLEAGEGTASGISVAGTSYAISQFLAAHPVDER